MKEWPICQVCGVDMIRYNVDVWKHPERSGERFPVDYRCPEGHSQNKEQN